MSLLPVLLAAAVAAAPALDEAALRDGDVVFHESTSSQSDAIALATGSRYTHVGIVPRQDGRAVVLEAVQPVKLTPLSRWIARGKGGHVVVKRLADADAVWTPEAVAKLHALGKAWLGKSYDGRFQWSDDRLYCSELVHKLVRRAAGVALGATRPAGSFDLSSPAVRKKLRERFGRGAAFDPAEPVLAPQAILDDPRLVTVATVP